MPADLLFEVGCEEIPAKMLTQQLVDLPALVEKRLAEARLEHQGVRALGTPRRLAIIVKALSDRQPDLNEEVVGPPVSAAFAADGSVTPAGAGFAKKNGVDPASLQKKEVAGKKGQYAVAVRSVVGEDARKLLPALLAGIAESIHWKKSQRWGWGEVTFVRPVQWLVALFGGEVVPFQFAGFTATRNSRGHRFLANTAVEISSPDHYVEALRAAHVVVDPAMRKELVQAELARIERESGLRVRPDEPLLAEVINLGEYPVGVAGEFDPSFLEVPEEVIVTAMRTHQRYFALERADGTLANWFATMMATVVRDPAVVMKGNQKVLASRLSDAKFFFAEDKKKGSFDAWNTKLETVVFQQKLGEKRAGELVMKLDHPDHSSEHATNARALAQAKRAKTIGDKVRRIEEIAEVLAQRVGADVATVKSAAAVCKADLASGAVGEFPELQGVMGRHYAKHFGLSAEVALAVDEHWWPKGQGAALPTSVPGALLALADRMDTIVGCFAVGLEPSGSADPFGLRRAAIGIWQILLSRSAWAGLWPVLFETTQKILAAHEVILENPASVEEFFRSRLRGIFSDAGIAAQDADAALTQDFRDPIDARARATAIAKIPREAREVFKRVANILDDARNKKIEIRDEVDPKLFVSDGNVEHRLYDAIREAQQREADARSLRNYAAVFESLVQLQPTVAAFFDKGGVMVMDPDTKLRDNRLALLQGLLRPYMEIADFRKLGGTS
ncbi:MAG: glycine--tRNA ligase subunit beta [Myxococcota bacterium]|nr:glycine--tRNA ligase subunit beta [Myxococcota bacterium]